MDTPTIVQPLTITWEGDRAAFAKAFVAAQKASEAVKKANTNDHFKSKYADLAGVVEAVMPALNEAGIGVLQFPDFDGQTVSVATTLLHESGSSVTGVLNLRPTKMDPQGVGSAITYGRRYSLLAMSGAAPEDDDGNAASGPAPQQQGRGQQRESKPPTLSERADRLEATLKGVKTAADLTKAYDLGSALRSELDAKDPDRLADLDKVYAQREAELSPVEDREAA